MIPNFLKHIDECIRYIEQIGGRIEKDQDLSEKVSFHQIECKNYEEAIHHLHAAINFLKQQKAATLKYQQDEEEEEEQRELERQKKLKDEEERRRKK